MYKLLEDEAEAIEKLSGTVLRAHIRIQPKALLTTFGLPLPTLVTEKNHAVYVFENEKTSEVFTLYDYCLTYDPTKRKYRKARVCFQIGSFSGCDCSHFGGWLTEKLGLTPEFTAFKHATILKHGEKYEQTSSLA